MFQYTSSKTQHTRIRIPANIYLNLHPPVSCNNQSPINLKNSSERLLPHGRLARQLTATLETYADAEPVSSADLLEHLQDLGFSDWRRPYIFRRVFAKMRTYGRRLWTSPVRTVSKDLYVANRELVTIQNVNDARRSRPGQTVKANGAVVACLGSSSTAGKGQAFDFIDELRETLIKHCF